MTSAWNQFAVRMAEALMNPKDSDKEDLEPLWDELTPEEQNRFEDMLKKIKSERTTE